MKGICSNKKTTMKIVRLYSVLLVLSSSILFSSSFLFCNNEAHPDLQLRRLKQEISL
jgi:hypothetical protein